MPTPFFVQTPAVTLYTGMAGSDVTCRITPYPVDLDGVKLTIADFGSIPTFTVDPKISGSEEINRFTAIVDNGDNTATLTGLTRNLLGKSPYTVSSAGGKIHSASAVVVFSDNPQLYQGIIDYVNGIALAGTVNATTSLQGLVQLATTAQVNAGTATGSTGAALGVTPDGLLASNYGTYLPSSGEKTFLTQMAAGMIGVPIPTLGKTADTGFIMLDGSTISRTVTYSALFAKYNKSATFTVTLASPAVFTATAHGLIAGDRVHFTTTGALPTGLAPATEYFVLSTGLTANTFRVALSPEGTVINTSVSQSGTHTLYNHIGGIGDGSTTWTLPNFSGKSLIGAGTGTETIKFETGAVGTNVITIPSLSGFPYQGQAVVFSTTGTLPTGISLATTYYVTRITTTSISLCSTLALADGNNPDITFTATGSAGVHTITYTNVARTIIGQVGGEESHAIATTELATHAHGVGADGAPGFSFQNNGGASINGTYPAGSAFAGIRYKNTDSVGGNQVHNNMHPFFITNWMTKY